MFELQQLIGGAWVGIGALCEHRDHAASWLAAVYQSSRPDVRMWHFRIAEVDPEPTYRDVVPADEGIDLNTGELSDTSEGPSYPDNIHYRKRMEDMQ